MKDEGRQGGRAGAPGAPGPLGAAGAMVLASLLAAAVSEKAPMPRTWQEDQKFRSGPTAFEPLMRFWYELDRVSDLVSVRPLTRILLDRDFTLVTIARASVTSPQDARRDGAANAAQRGGAV